MFISQHIGDLETAQAYDAFRRVIDSLSGLYEFQPDAVACDLHPDYLSTQFAEVYAEQRGVPLVKVQHHFAHVAACMAENDLDGPRARRGVGRHGLRAWTARSGAASFC